MLNRGKESQEVFEIVHIHFSGFLSCGLVLSAGRFFVTKGHPDSHSLVVRDLCMTMSTLCFADPFCLFSDVDEGLVYYNICAHSLSAGGNGSSVTVRLFLKF